jgi:hypothetical protein
MLKGNGLTQCIDGFVLFFENSLAFLDLAQECVGVPGQVLSGRSEGIRRTVNDNRQVKQVSCLWRVATVPHLLCNDLDIGLDSKLPTRNHCQFLARFGEVCGDLEIDSAFVEEGLQVIGGL